MKNKLKKDEVKEYYGNVDPTANVQLQRLRKLIKKELKGSIEILSYQIPTFRYKDKNIVAIGAFKDHVSLFPLGNLAIKKLSDELKDYRTSKGTIQFPLSGDLPENLIKKIIKEKLKSFSLS